MHERTRWAPGPSSASGHSRAPGGRCRRTTEGLLEAADELAAESDEPVEQVRAELEEMSAAIDAMIRRVFVVATAV